MNWKLKKHMVFTDQSWLNKTVDYEQEDPDLVRTSKLWSSKPPDNSKNYLSENESNPMWSNRVDNQNILSPSEA